jgi:hypothetical protein
MTATVIARKRDGIFGIFDARRGSGIAGCQASTISP